MTGLQLLTERLDDLNIDYSIIVDTQAIQINGKIHSLTTLAKLYGELVFFHLEPFQAITQIVDLITGNIDDGKA